MERPSAEHVRDERQLVVASVAPTACSLGAFAVAALTSPLAGERMGAIVLCVLVLLVAAAGSAGGRMATATTAAMAALSFDFFHVAPYRVLHARTLAETLGLLLVVAAVTSRRR